MAYRLKRPVLVRVRREPEREFARGTKPACWRADVVGGAPGRLLGTAHESWSREKAIRGLLDRLRAAGYAGTARVLLAVASALVFLAALLLPDPAAAACRWYQDRTELGGGWVVVCDSPLETPRLGPVGTHIPDRPYVTPREGSVLGPSGTTCHRRYVCDRQRRCEWRDICK